jgi:zinc protease
MVHETTLDNGLTVLVQAVHTAPLASVWCWYRVGSRDEGPGVTGVSHWVEHMNFKGTANIPRDQVKGIIERFGGSWNGYTWLDQTTYLETATADALDRMLFIEAERMASCLYDPADCESERTVIISELQGGDNDPEQRLDTEITATAFKAHPYRHPTIGWIHDLRTMTRDDLYGHYRRYYVPNNATLVVVGDVDPADALRRVEAAFGAIPPGDPARRSATEEPLQEGERRVHLRKPGTTAYWRAAFHAPRFADPDFFPLLALDAVLTGASGLNIWSGGKVPTPQRRARLYRALVNRGLASSVGGFLAPTAEPFLYSISATVADGQTLAAVEDAVLTECDRIAQDGPTADELATVQAQLRARFVYDADSVTDVAHQLGYFATIDRWQAWPAVFTRLAAVTVDAVHGAARRYLAADNRTIGVFDPVPAERVGAGC